MKRLSNRARIAFALSVPATIAAAAAIVACSSSDATGTTASASTCADPTLTVEFDPAYSAYTDGSREFDVPFVVDGVSSSAVHWGLSDPSMGDVKQDTATGGIQVTLKKAGSVNVVATAGSLCGSAKLQVTDSSEDQYKTGSDRYNNGIALTGLGHGPRDGGGDSQDGGNGKTPSCTNCHGSGATNGIFKTVSHTPEQTAGFSDDDLTNIFRNGVVPDGGYFDETIVPYQQWQRFHQWSMTDDEAVGIVVYLRALTPTPQTGAHGDFGGRFPDGGHGGGHHDGGGNGGGGGTGGG